MENQKLLSFAEKEKICESIFISEGPFWHLYTDGRCMQNIFNDSDDFKCGMNLLAVSVCRTPEIKLIAFELMENHIHLILAGDSDNCLLLFKDYKRRLKRVFRHAGHIIDWREFNASLIAIKDIKMLRNEILYTHRNAYVNKYSYTPYNYPWGSGIAYFNSICQDIPVKDFNDLTYDDRRAFAHIRDIRRLDRLKFNKSTVHIPSFCDISLGESIFNDPRSYFNSLTRNAEAFSEIASRLKDSIFITDDEIFSIARSIAEELFNIKQLTLLDPDQKIRIAKELHFRFNANKQQLKRILKLEIAILNEIFPG